MSKRLFISHSWAYSERYDSMVNLLNNRDYFTWTNYSVPVDKAFEGMTGAELGQQLSRQIRPVNCAVIIGGMWANHSGWIKFELNAAVKMKKSILGVRPRGAQRMPTAITDVADRVVNWNSESIVAGIRAIT